MSMERLAGQGYAPIPQSISNTDTEDEDEHSIIRNVNSHQSSNEIHGNAEVRENGWRGRTNVPMNLGNDATDNQEGYRYCGDNVPIITPEVVTQDDFWKGRDMSLLRRCCLVFSIFFCFATVLVFLYILPCDNAAICPSVVDRQTVIPWYKTLEGIELHGPISIVHGNPYSLIFLLRGQRFGANSSTPPEKRQIPTDGGGVLSMHGNTGTPLWWVPLTKTPVDIDCKMFDSDGSGIPDCIVIGKELLLSVDPTAGISHWNTAIRTDSGLPLRTPDLDFDGIDDMVTTMGFEFPQPGLLLLSGKTGKVLSRYLDHNCPPHRPIRLNGLVSNNEISYSCEKKESDGTTKNVNLTLSLRTLVEAKIDNHSESNKNITPIVDTTKPKSSSTWNDLNNYTIQLTSYYQLNVENSGPCPGENCRSKIKIVLQKSDGDDRTIWDHSSNNSHAMRPAIYPMGENPYVTRLAIKIWQWDDTKDIINEYDKTVKRRLSERILMIIVNYTDVHVSNADQEEIIQFCKIDDCQPSMELQTRSIAIADLGDDGTWELIHYRSSYNDESSLLLTSKVQIIKLDNAVEQLTRTITD